jgi:hypothetical protein
VGIRAKHEPRFPVRYSDSIQKHPKLAKLLRHNEALTLPGIPPAAFDYRLGNRSALEWVPNQEPDQYRVSTDPRSGITNHPNREDDDRYILRLIGQVITVSSKPRRSSLLSPPSTFRPDQTAQRRFLSRFLPSLAKDICFRLLPLHFLSTFLAQKSHVKPQNHLNPTNKRKSSWHFSSTQPAILKTVERKRTILTIPPDAQRGLTY